MTSVMAMKSQDCKVRNDDISAAGGEVKRWHCKAH